MGNEDLHEHNNYNDTMTNLIGYIIIVSCVAAWVLTLGHKWRIIEWCQVHVTISKLNEMFHCDFCLSWWTAWVLVIALFCVTGDIHTLIVPFVSTCITRRLL